MLLCLPSFFDFEASTRKVKYIVDKCHYLSADCSSYDGCLATTELSKTTFKDSLVTKKVLSKLKMMMKLRETNVRFRSL